MCISKVLRSLMMILLIFSACVAWGETLYVYYPSTLQSLVVQKSVQRTNPDVTVMVFGKYRDFVTKAVADQPEVLLVRDGGLSDFSDYTIKYNAYRNGSNVEKYVLLSVEKAVDLSSITASTVIGVVDFKRRNEMDAFVGQILGVKPTVKHVTKVADLLALFNFGLAEAVLIPESDVAYFKEISNLNFVVTRVESNHNIAIIASKSDSSAALDVAMKISELVPNYIRSIEWRN